MMELEPHFDRFEHVCGTSGQAGNIQGRKIEGGNPFEAPSFAQVSATAAPDQPPDQLPHREGDARPWIPSLPTPGGERVAVLHEPLWLPARPVQLLRLLQ